VSPSQRESIVKTCDGDIGKWPQITPAVFWAERVTVSGITGMLPYYMVHGTHPTLPLDVVEATFLAPSPQGLMTTVKLISACAQQLLRREEDLAEIHERIVKARMVSAERFRRKFMNTITDYDFKPGDLVLIRNTKNDGDLREKTQPRYLGPYIVIRRNNGRAYVISEMDGSISRYTIAAFRLIPYYARTLLPQTVPILLELLDTCAYAVADPQPEPVINLVTGSDNEGSDA
jgi:hypothetical protein